MLLNRKKQTATSQTGSRTNPSKNIFSRFCFKRKHFIFKQHLSELLRVLSCIRSRERKQGKRIILKSLLPISVLPAAMKLQVIVTTTKLSFLFLVCQSTGLKVYYMKINLFIMNILGNHKLHHKCETHVI